MIPETPLATAVNEWQDVRIRTRRLTQKTADEQLRELHAFANHIGPNRPINSVTRTDAESWLAHLSTAAKPRSAGNYEPSTINHKCSPLRTFFADMFRYRNIDTDPWRDVPRLRERRRRPKSLDRETLDRLIAGSSFRDRTVIIVAATTGLRASELARMRVEHWDREAGTLTVIRSKSNQEQLVWIVGETLEELDAWVDYGLNGARVGPMWPSYKQKSKGITAESITRLVSRAAEAVNVSATSHQLRHTFGKRMADASVPLHIVQELMGHQSLSSTQIYVTPTEADTFRAMAERPSLSDAQ